MDFVSGFFTSTFLVSTFFASGFLATPAFFASKGLDSIFFFESTILIVSGLVSALAGVSFDLPTAMVSLSAFFVGIGSPCVRTGFELS